MKTHVNRKFIEITFGWGPVTYDMVSSQYTWGSCDHTKMILEMCWDSLGTLSFGLSQFHGHGSWVRVWSGPKFASISRFQQAIMHDIFIAALEFQVTRTRKDIVTVVTRTPCLLARTSHEVPTPEGLGHTHTLTHITSHSNPLQVTLTF